LCESQIFLNFYRHLIFLVIAQHTPSTFLLARCTCTRLINQWKIAPRLVSTSAAYSFDAIEEIRHALQHYTPFRGASANLVLKFISTRRALKFVCAHTHQPNQANVKFIPTNDFVTFISFV
jgi:hypothetical protein